MKLNIEIIRAEHMGFCFGVREAVDEVHRYVDMNRGQIYVLGMLVHNEFVIEKLLKKGVILSKVNCPNPGLFISVW